MKQIKLSKLILLLIVAQSLVLSVISAVPVQAGAETCEQLSGCDNPKIDLGCQREKIFDPTASCELCYCADTDSRPTQNRETVDLNIFGVQIRLNSDTTIASALYLAFSMFLGVIALATAAMGIYGSFRRARAESDEDIAASAKILTNALVGFILSGMALLLVLLVGGVLGLGSINEMISLQGFLQAV